MFFLSWLFLAIFVLIFSKSVVFQNPEEQKNTFLDLLLLASSILIQLQNTYPSSFLNHNSPKYEVFTLLCRKSDFSRVCLWITFCKCSFNSVLESSELNFGEFTLILSSYLNNSIKFCVGSHVASSVLKYFHMFRVHRHRIPFLAVRLLSTFSTINVFGA